MSQRHVAVIGGGYSGTLQAVQLVRRGARVTLIEREDRIARGVAYSTPRPDHLLNVRASAMSAFPDEPEHFAKWLEARGGDRNDFAERRLYGTYIEEILGSASADDLKIIRGEALDVCQEAGVEKVNLSGGGSVAADAAIVSIGNLPPGLPGWITKEVSSSGHYVGSPWGADFARGLGDEDVVLLIGTGLTAIDAALTLESAGFRGRTIALSRRGLLPRAHTEPAPPPPLEQVPEPRCTALTRFVRAESGRMPWRSAVDQMRPVTQQLWAGASPQERSRFLRHLRPYWDVHRHRIAPSIAERVQQLREEGRLHIAAAKIRSCRITGDAVEVAWQLRGNQETETVRVARIVNCTGPQTNIARAGEPLLRNLLASGRIRADVARIGIDVDETSAVRDRNGRASPSLFAIGPMTRGAWWEIVAVPDIRVQVEAVARRVAI